MVGRVLGEVFCYLIMFYILIGIGEVIMWMRVFWKNMVFVIKGVLYFKVGISMFFVELI